MQRDRTGSTALAFMEHLRVPRGALSPALTAAVHLAPLRGGGAAVMGAPTAFLTATGDAQGHGGGAVAAVHLDRLECLGGNPLAAVTVNGCLAAGEVGLRNNDHVRVGGRTFVFSARLRGAGGPLARSDCSA